MLSAGWKTPLDGTYPTLAQVLRDHGYVTAGFVANLIYGSSAHGLNRGFIFYEDFPISVGQTLLSSSLGAMISTNNHFRRLLNYHAVLNRKTAAQVNEEFIQWLSSHDRQPFFTFINYMDAHEPYLPPKPFDEKFGPPRSRGYFLHTSVDAFRPAKWQMSEKEVQIETAAYEGSIAYLDDQIGRLIDELKKQGLFDNTLLIIVGDHGEHLGEHRLFGHGNSLYRQVLEVPLLISFPGHIPAGVIVRKPVSLRDIPATVMDLIDGETSFPGASLSRYWKVSENNEFREDMLISEARQRTFGVQQPWYPLNKGDMNSIVAAGYHYIQNQNGDEELYDFEHDRAEGRNLATSEEGQQIIQQLRTMLQAVITPGVPN